VAAAGLLGNAFVGRCRDGQCDGGPVRAVADGRDCATSREKPASVRQRTVGAICSCQTLFSIRLLRGTYP